MKFYQKGGLVLYERKSVVDSYSSTMLGKILEVEIYTVLET